MINEAEFNKQLEDAKKMISQLKEGKQQLNKLIEGIENPALDNMKKAMSGIKDGDINSIINATKTMLSEMEKIKNDNPDFK